MITFFTTPKPFRGHIGVIQRNAIESWKRIHPSAEVILFGDEEGAAEAARDLRIRHIPSVKRNEHGTKYLSPIFDGARISRTTISFAISTATSFSFLIFVLRLSG